MRNRGSCQIFRHPYYYYFLRKKTSCANYSQGEPRTGSEMNDLKKLI